MILENLPPEFKSAQWLPLVEYEFIGMCGKEAENFFQKHAKCIMTSNSTGVGVYCSKEGKILLTFRFFNRGNTYFLSLPKNQIAFAVEVFQKKFRRIQIEKEKNIASIGFILGKFVEFPSSFSVKKTIFNTLSLKGSSERAQVISSTYGIKKLISELSVKNEVEDLSLWKLIDIQSGFADIYLETRNQFTSRDLNYFKNKIPSEVFKEKQSHLKLAFLSSERLPIRGEKIFYVRNKRNYLAGYVVDFALKTLHDYALLIFLHQPAKSKVLWIGDELNRQLINCSG